MRRVSYEVSRSVALLALVVFGTAGWAAAGALDPLGFTSLGAFPTAPGTYIYSLDPQTSAPTLSGPGGTFTGVPYSDAPGHQIAVFDFNSINLSNNQSLVFPFILPYSLSPDLPLALLSRGDATINGTINVSAPFPTAGVFSPGGPGGFNSGSGPGAGGSGGNGLNGDTSNPGGGGFGGRGGNGGRVDYVGPPTYFQAVPFGGGAGGSSYGNLAVSLQGGSGGGQYGSRLGISSGGGGGGAIEIGAVGRISVAGSILANGSTGGLTHDPPTSGGGVGGGGSGGGIFLHGDSVTLASSAVLSAQGGGGAGGGGGGGGRVLIEYGASGFSGDVSSINVSGGAGNPLNIPPPYPPTSDAPGDPGVITITVVPEPASLVLLGIGLLGVLSYARYASRQAAA